ncbi:hypothetical protein TWF481_001738 [Arthrobotrys musiformis]|uniref:Uncharacterized protein n=1 Tax=Arthrobotrys musiformis TaxID=47236 RepID=A0AAV9W077_9PEZI
MSTSDTTGTTLDHEPTAAAAVTMANLSPVPSKPLLLKGETKLSQSSLSILDQITIRSVWMSTARRIHIPSNLAKARVWIAHMEEVSDGTIGGLLSIRMDNSINLLHEAILRLLRGEPKYLNRIPGIRKEVFSLQAKDIEAAIKRYERAIARAHEESGPSSDRGLDVVLPLSSLGQSHNNEKNGTQTISTNLQSNSRPNMAEAGNRSQVSSAPPQIMAKRALQEPDSDAEFDLRELSTALERPRLRKRTFSYHDVSSSEGSHSNDYVIPKRRGGPGAGKEPVIRSCKANAGIPEEDDEDGDPSKDKDEETPTGKRRRGSPGKARQPKRARITSSVSTITDDDDATTKTRRPGRKKATGSPATRKSLRNIKAAAAKKGKPITPSTTASASDGGAESSQGERLAITPISSIESTEILTESKALQSRAKSHLDSCRKNAKKATTEARLNKLTQEMAEVKEAVKSINSTLEMLLAFCKGEDL